MHFSHAFDITPKTHNFPHTTTLLLLHLSLSLSLSLSSLSEVSAEQGLLSGSVRDRDDHKVIVFGVMGSCSSSHRNSDTDMKLKLSFGSKNDKLVVPSSPPIKEKSKNGQFRWSPSRSTTTLKDNVSKEETYFDSKPWLDSDCEDDFYSVNGDFTPSRGNTPIHHTFGTPVGRKTPSENRIPGSMPGPSPEKKKKLLELFQESFKDDQDDGNGKQDVKPTIQDVLPKSSNNSTPYISGANSACSSERTMSEDRASIREKSAKSVQWCLPGLSSCRSFSERRRKTSPAIAVNGKH